MQADLRATSFNRVRRFNTGVLFLFLIYSLLPIYYLVVSATKSSSDLYSTFGLWFSSDFHLIQNLGRPFCVRRRAVSALARKLAPLFGGGRGRREFSSPASPDTASRATSFRAGASC